MTELRGLRCGRATPIRSVIYATPRSALVRQKRFEPGVRQTAGRRFRSHCIHGLREPLPSSADQPLMALIDVVTPAGRPIVLHAAGARAVVQERRTGCRTGAKETHYSSSGRSGWFCLISAGAQSIRASMMPPKVSASRTRPGMSSLIATRTPVSSQMSSSTLNECAIPSVPFRKARKLEHSRPEGKHRIAHRSSSAPPRAQLRRGSRTFEPPAMASGHAPRSDITSKPGRPQT